MRVNAMLEYQNLLKLDKEKALRKATEEFVAYYFYEVFKKMWDSIPRSGLIPETPGEKFFRDMMIYEVSRKVASQDASNLTEMILRSLHSQAYQRTR